jgi:hypothetical protein
MDPNVALAKIREAVGELRQSDDDGVWADDSSQIGMLLEQFEALDEWLSRGGFLPKDWMPKPVKEKKVAPREMICSSHDTMEKCSAWTFIHDKMGQTAGHYYLRAGDLAWYDALWGPAKVKIIRITRGRKVYFTFTTDSGPYKKGNHEWASIIYVFPRSALNVRRQRFDGVPVWFEITSEDES